MYCLTLDVNNVDVDVVPTLPVSEPAWLMEMPLSTSVKVSSRCAASLSSDSLAEIAEPFGREVIEAASTRLYPE